MYINSIMIPFLDLTVISVENTIEEAINIIEKEDFLSLPVVNKTTFIGILSKKYIFETFFKEYPCDKNMFVKRKVKEFMKTKIPTINTNIYLEDAAKIFIDQKLQFIPVINDNNEFLGIVTHSSLFRQLKSIFGFGLPKIVIYTYDFKGKLAKISEIIAKCGGNIKNIVQLDTKVMGLQEISLCIDTQNIKNIVHHLENNGFKVGEISQ